MLQENACTCVIVPGLGFVSVLCPYYCLSCEKVPQIQRPVFCGSAVSMLPAVLGNLDSRLGGTLVGVVAGAAVFRLHVAGVFEPVPPAQVQHGGGGMGVILRRPRAMALLELAGYHKRLCPIHSMF